MKQTSATPTNGVAGGNLASLRTASKTLAGLQGYLGILEAIADCLDNIAAGDDQYVLVGSTRNRDSYTFNWKGDGAPGPVYATDLRSLSTIAGDLV